MRPQGGDIDDVGNFRSSAKARDCYVGARRRMLRWCCGQNSGVRTSFCLVNQKESSPAKSLLIELLIRSLLKSEIIRRPALTADLYSAH